MLARIACVSSHAHCPVFGPRSPPHTLYPSPLPPRTPAHRRPIVRDKRSFSIFAARRGDYSRHRYG